MYPRNLHILAVMGYCVLYLTAFISYIIVYIGQMILKNHKNCCDILDLYKRYRKRRIYE